MKCSLYLTVCLATATSLWINPHDALANCAESVTYYVTTEGSSVTICPQNFADRACPDSTSMLRENVATSEVVQIPDRCVDSCYVDQCVAAGEYRYGFATPYQCAPSSCGTDYYEDITVAAWDGDCTASDSLSSTPYSGQLPWGTDQSICGYGGSTSGSGCSQVAGTGLSLPLQVVFANGIALLFGCVLLARRRS